MTPSQIAKLPQGTYPITQCPQLRLEVRASKKTWTRRYKGIDGKLKQEVLGYYIDMSLAGAMAACETAKRQGSKPKAAAALTVRQVVHAYVVEHVQARRKNKVRDAALIWRHLEPIADRDAVTIGRADAHAFLAALASRPAIQRRMKTELGSAFEWGMTAGAIPDGVNPWSRIKVAPAGKRQRFLSDGELKLLVPWLWKGGVSATVRDALLLTLATGCRSGEVIGMQWSEVDLDKGEWTMPTSKNGLGRTVYLNVVALDVLKGLADVCGREGFVFASQQQHLLANGVWAVREACPVKGWSPHTLRKTMRTGIAKLGCPHEIAERLIGHTIGGVSAVYDMYSYGKEQQEWMQKWGTHLTEVVL